MSQILSAAARAPNKVRIIMPRLPSHPTMVLTNKDIMHKYTLAHLPEDLLAHVLRFTTSSLRRDGHPGRPASVRHLRYAAVSPAFRRAFLRHLHAVVFDHPASTRLAQLNWGSLRACIALRKIVVTRAARLNDTQLISLFSLLAGRGIFIRDFELTLSEDVTAVTLVALAGHFGSYLTRLRVALVTNPRAPRIRTTSVNHPPTANDAVGNEDEFDALPPLEPQDAEAAPVVQLPQALFGEPDDVPPLGAGGNLQNPGWPNPPAINWNQWDLGNNHFVGGPVLAPIFPPQMHHGFIDRAIQLAAQSSNRNKFTECTAVETGDDVPIYTVSSRAEYEAVQVFANELGIHPAFARNVTELLGDLTPRAFIHGQLPPNGITDASIVSDEVVNDILSRMPNLVDLAIIRTKFVSDQGVLAFLKCPLLEKLQLCHLPKVTDDGLATAVKGLSKLRELSLSKLPSVGDNTIRALVSGDLSSTFQSLKLVMMDRVTDSIIQSLVNGCESLKSVTFMYCSRITNTAASHVSCSRKVESVIFCPYFSSPLSYRAVVHLACGPVNLRSLTLGSCKRIGLAAIVAMSNLPGLRKLHMGGLCSLSLDTMKVLGAFSRLENLLLQGDLYLTDLGVKLLCGQRGHRFIHLVLSDSTKQMSDEALDCIMTWCTSLRTLEVCGNFKSGVLGRLHDAIPHADIRVLAAVDNVGGFVDGDRCVWD